MSNPYYWPFPQRDETMYMSTVGTLFLDLESNVNRLSPKPSRYSAFQIQDISGATCKQQIPQTVTRDNYSLSTKLEPRPENWKTIKKVSNPLKHDDIEGSMPQAS